MNLYSIRVSGPAGFGINTLGELILNLFLLKGYFVYGYKEYSSLIKGGNNFYQINISDNEYIPDTNEIDFLIAIDQKAIDIHSKYLKNRSFILAKKSLNTKFSVLDNLYDSSQNVNILLFIAFCKLYNFDKELAINAVKFRFNKSEKLDNFISYVNTIFDEIKFDNYLSIDFKPVNHDLSIKTITGNEAICESAIKSGLGYYSAYPMTPATSILTYLAKKQKDYNFVIKQMEDEIAVIHSALGASFAGARSMCATSGGGFALMAEAIGNAIVAEIPIVIVLSSRTGPSTGIPTFNGQSDLDFALNPTFGDIENVVIAPSDIYDIFYLISKAFNIADKYQLPVIFLLDKNLSECRYCFFENKIKLENINRGKLLLEKVDDGYMRYKITDDGISPRTIPGVENGQHLCTSYEHHEDSSYLEDSESKIKMTQKRAIKLNNLFDDWDGYIYEKSSQNNEILFITFGENKILLKSIMNEENIDILIIQCLKPLNLKIIDIIKQYKKIFVVEQNFSGMLKNYLQCKTGIKDLISITKYDGRPFYIEEIIDFINNKI